MSHLGMVVVFVSMFVVKVNINFWLIEFRVIWNASRSKILNPTPGHSRVYEVLLFHHEGILEFESYIVWAT